MSHLFCARQEAGTAHSCSTRGPRPLHTTSPLRPWLRALLLAGRQATFLPSRSATLTTVPSVLTTVRPELTSTSLTQPGTINDDEFGLLEWSKRRKYHADGHCQYDSVMEVWMDGHCQRYDSVLDGHCPFCDGRMDTVSLTPCWVDTASSTPCCISSQDSHGVDGCRRERGGAAWRCGVQRGPVERSGRVWR